MNINNLFDVKSKVVLITGGSRGIGEMMASGFLANGAKVYISSRKIKDCDATAKRLSEKYESECISIPADISDLNGINELTIPSPRGPILHAKNPDSPPVQDCLGVILDVVWKRKIKK